MIQQLPLSVALRDDARFANFYAASNEAVIQCLQQQWQDDGDSFLFIAGHSGYGKSHLLQASCHFAEGLGHTSVYLPLTEILDLGPDLLQGLENIDLVVIDDLHCIAGDRDWQVGLFHLFNRIKDNNGRLLVAANAQPKDLNIELADLRSRMSWGIVFALQTLNDDDKCAALQLRASKRGLSLADDVARFLIAREQRDMSSLLTSLDRLDHASLASKRRLTIPFVKETLDW